MTIAFTQDARRYCASREDERGRQLYLHCSEDPKKYRVRLIHSSAVKCPCYSGEIIRPRRHAIAAIMVSSPLTGLPDHQHVRNRRYVVTVGHPCAAYRRHKERVFGLPYGSARGTILIAPKIHSWPSRKRRSRTSHMPQMCPTCLTSCPSMANCQKPYIVQLSLEKRQKSIKAASAV